jgi:phosphotransferase system enzyme I (PtsI)
VSSEGVGLFRTEVLYLGRNTAPPVKEQVEAYRAVFEAFAGRKVVIRTLDAGADKPLPFIRHAPEANPALGVRGLRVARRQPELLTDQLTAIAEAASSCAAEVWVMAPMRLRQHRHERPRPVRLRGRSNGVGARRPARRLAARAARPGGRGRGGRPRHGSPGRSLRRSSR